MLFQSMSNTCQIHVSRSDQPDEDPKFSGQAVKLMHRFEPEEVQAKMDVVEGRTE